MRIASFQRRVRFLFHAWRVTFNPIYMVETLHLQFLSPSIISSNMKRKRSEKLIDKKGEILFFFLVPDIT